MADPEPIQPSDLRPPAFFVSDDRNSLCDYQYAVDGARQVWRARGCEGRATGLVPIDRHASAAELARIESAFAALGDADIPCDAAATGHTGPVSFRAIAVDTTTSWTACLTSQADLPAPFAEAWDAVEAAAE